MIPSVMCEAWHATRQPAGPARRYFRYVPDRPEIVCICGSTRFADEMRAANRDLTLAGVIVVAPGVFARAGDHEADELITDEQKAALDALHLRKIDLADRVLVVNPGGYIGESPSREIAYAHATGKPISFTDPVWPVDASCARATSSSPRHSTRSRRLAHGLVGPWIDRRMGAVETLTR